MTELSVPFYEFYKIALNVRGMTLQEIFEEYHCGPLMGSDVIDTIIFESEDYYNWFVLKFS